MVAAGDKRAKIIEDLQKDPHRLLAIVQIGVTLVGSTASAVGGIIAAEHLKPLLQSAPYELVRNAAEPLAVSIVVIIVSYLSLIIGELVPKTIGLQYADTMALYIAKPLSFLARISSFAITFLTISSKGVLRLMRIRGGAVPSLPARRYSILLQKAMKPEYSARLKTNISATYLTLPIPASAR